MRKEEIKKNIILFVVIMVMIQTAIICNHIRMTNIDKQITTTTTICETPTDELTSVLHTTEECSESVSEETSSVVYILSTTETTTSTTTKMTKLSTYDDEIELIASVVMNEAGYESYEGKIAVAQCIQNAMIREGKKFTEIRYKYGYTRTKSPNRDSLQAVKDVFYNGVKVTDEPILFYYNPDYGYSSFHESQTFVMSIGGHRFFKLKG